MEQLPRTRYSQEFREQSVKFLKESELTLVEASKRLSLPKGTLKNWVYAERQANSQLVGKKQNSLTELELELSRIKRELAEVKMERDFIKKCAAYFAKESR
ncbi:transposase [Nitrosomonas communis]|uniref:Transposase n=1 Tax=Nitrosomonas communis TaxID=44574 RepID=A0A1I4W8Q5_9PROT|nr:transposase [Nitrosomonas communis]SFN09797.1 transposase [Nitrosomonas communis]